MPELGIEYLTMVISLVISGQIVSKPVLLGIFIYRELNLDKNLKFNLLINTLPMSSLKIVSSIFIFEVFIIQSSFKNLHQTSIFNFFSLKGQS